MTIASTHLSLLREMADEGQRDRAWAAFQQRYGEVIRGWCLRRGLAEADAEDLTQEVLLKLFVELPRHEHDPARGRFRAWLKAVVNNALTDRWRRQQRWPEGGGVGGTAFQQQLADLADPAEELSVLIEEQAESAAADVFERVQARVKETTWQAFYQTLVENRPAGDVAAELGLSVGGVYKSAYRVKRMLQEGCGDA